jgi:hypothetical protein
MGIDQVPTIPTMRPKLPSAERLIPYFEDNRLIALAALTNALKCAANG